MKVGDLHCCSSVSLSISLWPCPPPSPCSSPAPARAAIRRRRRLGLSESPRLGEPCGELHLAAGKWGPQPLFGVARAPPDQPGSQDQVEGEEAKCYHFYSPGRCLVDALLRRLTEAVADDSEQTSLH